MSEQARKHPLKIYILIIILVLVLIVALQNTQAVALELLFVTVYPPLVLLILGSLILGIIIGWLWHRRGQKKKPAPPAPPEE